MLVAEGVERGSQVDALRKLGCPFGQGFQFWRPLGHDAVEVRLGAIAGALPSAAPADAGVRRHDRAGAER